MSEIDDDCAHELMEIDLYSREVTAYDEAGRAVDGPHCIETTDYRARCLWECGDVYEYEARHGIAPDIDGLLLAGWPMAIIRRFRKVFGFDDDALDRAEAREARTAGASSGAAGD